jgi:hypothetical protein
MAENQKPPSDETQPGPNGEARRYWIDDDGNVHGIVMTMEVDHLFEFACKAIPLTSHPDTPGRPNPNA